ncbi:hypothetical protein HPG69_012679, partial [Diceros bicornis minor]
GSRSRAKARTQEGARRSAEPRCGAQSQERSGKVTAHSRPTLKEPFPPQALAPWCISTPPSSAAGFTATAFEEDTRFLRFDSNRANQSVSPRATWLEKMGPDYRDGEKDLIKTIAATFRPRLSLRMRIKGTRLMLCCCVVAPNRTFLRGLFKLAYDAEDFIYVDEDLQTCTATHSLAEMTKHR